MAGLYIHIPFCKLACHYCDFHFSTNQDHREDLVRTIVKELQLQKNYLQGEPLETIYFGGGTPSILTAPELQTIFDSIHSNYLTVDNPEVTFEANPDDLTIDKLNALKLLRINRLSIGIQSFDDTVLKFLNRAHSANEAERCFQAARSIGFDNISVDLIYAIPGQDQLTWERNVDRVLLLNPEHLSSYSLTIEEKTVFGKWQKNGTLKPVEDESAARQFEILMDKLQLAGYDHYEISNFSQPGRYSRHNSNYWKQQSYLGIGPGAHSYDKISRQFNVSNNVFYYRAIEQDRIPFEREVLTRENKINEYIFTTLRTSWGCNLDKISLDFGFDLVAENEDYIDEMIQKKLIAIEGKVLTLTRSGKLFADKIAADLFIEKKVDS